MGRGVIFGWCARTRLPLCDWEIPNLGCTCREKTGKLFQPMRKHIACTVRRLTAKNLSAVPHPARTVIRDARLVWRQDQALVRILVRLEDFAFIVLQFTLEA
jgi:hypothetical protein